MHYVEINDLKDLEKIKKYDDSKLQQISQNAMDFVENNLSPDDMVAYIILVLQRLEGLQHLQNKP